MNRRAATFLSIVLSLLILMGIGRNCFGATFSLSPAQHDSGTTPLTLSIDLDEGETYDFFRVHIGGGAIIHRSLHPRDVFKVAWKMEGSAWPAWARASGTQEDHTWSSLEVRIDNFHYEGSEWTERPMHVEQSGIVLGFDLRLVGDTPPCLYYARIGYWQGEQYQTDIPLSSRCNVAKATESSWAQVKELYR